MAHRITAAVARRARQIAQIAEEEVLKTSIRVSLTILCALSLAFALPVTAQDPCTRCGFVNVAIGIDALHSNTTGVFNTATGRNALSSNTTGISNTATGTDTLS
ncbi:MAG: hypothetical protein ACREKS_24240, partial [Candidatus Rokuibacteriota bacterium]